MLLWFVWSEPSRFRLSSIKWISHLAISIYLRTSYWAVTAALSVESLSQCKKSWVLSPADLKPLGCWCLPAIPALRRLRYTTQWDHVPQQQVETSSAPSPSRPDHARSTSKPLLPPTALAWCCTEQRLERRLLLLRLHHLLFKMNFRIPVHTELSSYSSQAYFIRQFYHFLQTG